MKKFQATVAVLLVVSGVWVAQIEVVKAQDPLNIMIKPDGGVVPDTDLLERNGNTYTFTGDVLGIITVQKNGVTIDGDGYTLQGRNDIDERGIYLYSSESYPSCKDVLVKNLRICNFSTGIFVAGASNNSIIGNYFENARIHILGGADDGDLIKNNTFRDTWIFVDYNPRGLDVITENNFFNSWIAAGLSAVPIVQKNYWSDYNGTDADGDGIGDTPHTSQHVLDEIVQDPYPLMAPLDLEVIPEFPSSVLLVAGVFAATVLTMFSRYKLRQMRKK
jgi:nitrous oxidase accessory protein NosD